MTSLLDPQTPPSPDPRPWLRIDERQGRMIRVGDHWLADFTAGDYLGLDLEPGDAGPTEVVEAQLTALLGCEDVRVMPSIAAVHAAAIPLLAGDGKIFRHRCPDQLEQALRATSGAKLVLVESVDAVTGDTADLRSFAAVARAHGARLYIDDTHGFGVLGERHPHETCAYGRRGNGAVKHADELYDDIVLVGGCSDAAFIACPTELKQQLEPGPAGSLASLLRVNEERGDALRARLCALTMRVLNAVDGAGVHTPNRSGFPIIALPVRDRSRLAEVHRLFFDRGIALTPDTHGLRAQITAAHSDDEIFMLIETIEDLGARLRPRADAL